MHLSKSNIRLIFGLKLKQLRKENNLSLSELAKKSSLSVSYLNEIESGKKYPKSDKIILLAKALGVPYDKLVSLRLTKNLSPIGDLLEANIFEQLPLEHYGIDINKLVMLISNAPLQLSALVSTLIEMAQSSEINQNIFSRTALRTYKEFNENYFENIEQSVDKFFRVAKLRKSEIPVSIQKLTKILIEKYNYEIREDLLSKDPVLKEIRAVMIKNDKNILLLNQSLSEAQKIFIISKELAYNFLNLNERPFIYSDLRVDTFDQLLNNLNASYFATALMISKDSLLDELKPLLNSSRWNENTLSILIEKYNVTPEILFQRITNLNSKFLKLNNFFYLRFSTIKDSGIIKLTKEIKLNTYNNPGGYQNTEHFCRRWLPVKLLNEIQSSTQNKFITGTQILKYFESGDEYLTVSIARKSNSIENKFYSITLGFLLNEETKSIIKFWNDPQIQVESVGDTCERCPIKNCKERTAEPDYLKQVEKLENIKESLKQLSSKLKEN